MQWANTRGRNRKLFAVGGEDLIGFFLCVFAPGSMLALGLNPVAPALLLAYGRKRQGGIGAGLGGIIGSILLLEEPAPLFLALAMSTLALGISTIFWEKQRILPTVKRYLPLVVGYGTILLFLTKSIYMAGMGILELNLGYVFAPVLIRGMEAGKRALKRQKLLEVDQMSLMALLCVLVLLIGGREIYGFFPARILGICFTMVVAFYMGPIWGAVTGIVMGGLCVLIGLSPFLIGALGICGLCTGLCNAMGKIPAVGGFFLSGIVFTLVANETPLAILPFWEQMIAGAGLCIFPPNGLGFMARTVGMPSGPIELKLDPIPTGGVGRRKQQLGEYARAMFAASKAVGHGESPQKNIMSKQLDEVALSLNNLAAQEGNRQKGLERRVEAALMDKGIFYHSVVVEPDGLGRHLVTVYTRPCGGKEDCGKFIRRAVTAAMGMPYAIERLPCRGRPETVCALTFLPSPKLVLQTACFQAKKPGMAENGDTFLMEDIAPGVKAAVLCDGMGSGPIAHRESETAAELLLRFKRAGMETKMLAKNVNTLMALREKEVFSTGDMLILDLVKKSCEILKMSAPPTFFLRGDRAEWISGKSLPLGALEEIEPFYAQRDLAAGDIIIMFSDGVADCIRTNREMGNWLLGQRQRDTSIDRIGKTILQTAKRVAGNGADDMTVVVMKLTSI
ncbi:SpoIIE family protein phosphatase [Eubacteriales bacterium OttesenSCG-928-M02]|nr:SpoIIE family protein phosphatase [Eubacteriales bacterium OttesenSCG-928-M02]